MFSRSFCSQFSVEFRNRNMWWLNKTKTSSAIINNSLSIYNLHASMSTLLLYVSSTTFLMIGKASRSDAAALPSFANLHCWKRNVLLTTFFFSHIRSNKSTYEHDLANFSCVINPERASIPLSTSFFTPKEFFYKTKP